MNIIKEDIKMGKFKTFYLLYGTESYLKKLYRDKIKESLIEDGDEMNFNYFEGKSIDENELISVAQTLPFFSDKRLILVENSELFNKQSLLGDLTETIPDSTTIVFIEDKVNKRYKLFKNINKNGHVSEFNGLDPRNLKMFLASLLKDGDKKITGDLATYFIDKTGPNMEIIMTEAEKIISYAYNREVITKEDIDAIVTTQITGKIFEMIDAIGSKQRVKALNLYYDLVKLRESSMTILYLINRQFNILLQVRELHKSGRNSQEIASSVGIPPFAVRKNINQANNFTSNQLRNALEFGTDIEHKIKTGRIIDSIGIELMIVSLSG